MAIVFMRLGAASPRRMCRVPPQNGQFNQTRWSSLDFSTVFAHQDPWRLWRFWRSLGHKSMWFCFAYIWFSLILKSILVIICSLETKIIFLSSRLFGCRLEYGTNKGNLGWYHTIEFIKRKYYKSIYTVFELHPKKGNIATMLIS